MKKVYELYNQFILGERASQWVQSDERVKKAEKKVQALKNQQDTCERAIEQLTVDKRKFEEQKAVSEEESRSLQQHEVWKLEETRRTKLEESTAIQTKLKELDEKWSRQNHKLNEAWKEKEATESNLLEFRKEAGDFLKDLLIESEESGFRNHELNVEDYQRADLQTFDFTFWLKEAGAHQKLIGDLEKLADEVNRLTEDDSRLQRTSSEKKAKIDDHQKDYEHLEQWFDEQHHVLEGDVFKWIQDHPKLIFSPEVRQELSRLLQGLYERNRFDDVRDLLYSAIHYYEAELNTTLMMTMEKENKQQEVVKEAEEELQRLNMQKMIEPDRPIGTTQHRDALKEKGRAFVPFYAAVEFRDHVTEEQKERIESALKQTGVLDSLITDGPIAPQQDAVLHPDPQVLGYTLADYLIPDVEEDGPISKEQVDEVLRSLSLEREENGFHIDVDGSYSVGCLVGHAPLEGPSKFIGRSSRKRHQREQIQWWTEKRREEQAILQNIQDQIHVLEEAIKRVQNWKEELPTDRHLLDIDQQMTDKKRLIFSEKDALQRIDKEWKTVNEKLNQARRTLRERGAVLNISLKKADLAKAYESAHKYVETLHALSRLTLKIANAMSVLKRIEARQEELEEELDLIKGEQNIEETKLSRVTAEIKSIKGQLELKGIEEVRQRIQDVQALIREANSQLETLLHTLPEKRAEWKSGLEELTDAKRDAAFWKNMRKTWETSLEQEQHRALINRENWMPSGLLEDYQSILEKNDRSKLLENLTKVYFNEEMHLTEYRMVIFSEELETPEWFSEDFGDRYEPFKYEWQTLKSRRLIQMDYRGQRVSPYYVSSALEKELADQRGYLDEQDRRLYEDIIVNSIGVILRTRIQRAQQWVKKMDQIMAERDNSSGLIFSIAWKPLTADSEQELDTKDLVQLLQRNSKFLSEEDLERITKHFQSRIGRAKELIQLRNEGSTLHQVLKEVLDYRKWFTFVLSYSRVNEPKRELTNNAFFKFSGGEKAMAMYIPLFTAAYSRYKEANGDAPYIISLDEAFAGVDENNIRDMFEVVEQLGFNYIMNSQALWGDYDTISGLSIAELVRNKNADYVTVIHYEWDGKQRSLVLDQMENQDQDLEELVVHES